MKTKTDPLWHIQVDDLPPDARLADRLCAEAEVVVFCAREGWPSQWVPLFATHGYHPYDLVRHRFWWDQRIPWWQRQNTLVYATDEVSHKHGWSAPHEIDLAQPALLIPELRKRLDATVCIPWRPSPSRLAAYERVKAFWAMFGWPVVTADSDTRVFSLAQARNNAVRKATTDVVIVADADTLIDPLNVLRAVADPVGVCWPFDHYRVLSQKYLDAPLHELVAVPHINTWDGQGAAGVGGCMVTTRTEWWRLGGQPPEFLGWGWEDTAFTIVVRTLSEVRRLHGCVYAFEHNTQADRYIGAKADSPGWDRDIHRNERLYDRYRVADRRAWLMREIIRQRDAERDDSARSARPS